MATYAVLDGGQVVGWRTIPDWDAYPERKRLAVDAKGDGGPVLRPRVIEGTGPNEQMIIESNRVRIVRSTPEPSLSDLKAQLSKQVDTDAEAVRQKYITPGDGMAMTYQEKHAQARAVIAMGETAANALTEAERDDQFPTLSASVGIEASTLFACAQLVVTRYEAFADLSRVIERTRLAGKKAIGEASDHASARAAYAGITWTV